MTQNIQRLREEFKSKLSRLNDYLWTAGLPDPMTRIQQIRFFFFLKMLEEQDIAKEKEEKLTGRKHHSIFAGKQEYKTQLLAQKAKLKEPFNSILSKSISTK